MNFDKDIFHNQVPHLVVNLSLLIENSLGELREIKKWVAIQK